MSNCVKSKFNIGDKVWFISNNKVQSLPVTGVCISVDAEEGCTVEHILHYNSSWVNECTLFNSKEELIESL